jgi:beta-galactosidase
MSNWLRVISLFVVVAYLLSACVSVLPPSQSAFQEQELAQSWQFQKGPHLANHFDIDHSKWQVVHLPHTTKVENKVIETQWQGIAYYQKEFSIDPAQQGKLISLYFDAAMNVAEVWLNGERLGKHSGGYLPFSFDITQLASYEKPNTLLVKLSNLDSAITGPKPIYDLDFNMYGGLYRSVRLEFKPQLHITDPVAANKIASGGIFIKPSVVFTGKQHNTSAIDIQTHVKNNSHKTMHFQLFQKLSYKNKHVKQTAISYTLAAGEEQDINQKLQVNNADLWHPNSPNLYLLRTELKQDDQLLQTAENAVGFRNYEFDESNQLLINGQKFFVRGVNYHQDYPYVGYAKSAQAEYRDAQLIKSAGFDFVRLSHYPHSPAFLKAADELGLVLLNPFLGWQYYNENESFKQNAYQRCRDLIRRDRNHPSVLAWECSLNETNMPADFIANLDKIVNEESPNTYSAGWQQGFDIYIQARQHVFKHPDEVKPNVPYMVSEYGDWEYYRFNAGANQPNWYKLPEEARFSRQLISAGEQRLLQQATNLQEAYIDNSKHNPVADSYWVMFDYNRGKFNSIESSGIASIDRLPKYSYYFYQSQRNPMVNSSKFDGGPMVFIASDWNQNSNPKVRVFTNSDKVELYLNNQLVATQSPVKELSQAVLPHPPITFDLANFESGTLVAKAFIKDKLVAQHQVSTPDQAVALKLKMASHGVPTAPNDTVFVHAQLVDENGLPTIDNDVSVQFSIQGDAQVINPENQLGIKTTKGIASALIRTGKNLSGITISAKVLNSPIKAQDIKL